MRRSSMPDCEVVYLFPERKTGLMLLTRRAKQQINMKELRGTVLKTQLISEPLAVAFRSMKEFLEASQMSEREIRVNLPPTLRSHT